MSEWYLHSYKKRLEESLALKRLLRITVYGSFNPDEEKQLLLRVVNRLRDQGYEDSDIVEGARRPNEWHYNRYQISTFYLENSDVNFMIFTHNGHRIGVTTELAHVLDNPKMCDKMGYCVVFCELKNGESAVGALQSDELLELNAKLKHVHSINFENEEELMDSVVDCAASFMRKLGAKLEQRKNTPAGNT